MPAHSQGCTYPSLRRLRLCAPSVRRAVRDGDGDGDDEMKGGRRGAARPAGLGVAERVLLEEYTWMIASGFEDSHKDAAKLLNGLQENFVVDAAEVLIEVVLSMPRPTWGGGAESRAGKGRDTPDAPGRPASAPRPRHFRTAA